MVAARWYIAYHSAIGFEIKWIIVCRTQKVARCRTGISCQVPVIAIAESLARYHDPFTECSIIDQVDTGDRGRAYEVSTVLVCILPLVTVMTCPVALMRVRSIPSLPPDILVILNAPDAPVSL